MVGPKGNLTAILTDKLCFAKGWLPEPKPPVARLVSAAQNRYSIYMNQSTLDLFEDKARMEDEMKFALCEEFADENELSVDYVWDEFVNPETSSLEEVQFVLARF
jgi:hypothetical protein